MTSSVVAALQWSTSGMFLAKCRNILFLQFLDSRGIDVGETTNDITLVLTMKLL
jgi:hypothetical protein